MKDSILERFDCPFLIAEAPLSGAAAARFDHWVGAYGLGQLRIHAHCAEADAPKQLAMMIGAPGRNLLHELREIADETALGRALLKTAAGQVVLFSPRAGAQGVAELGAWSPQRLPEFLSILLAATLARFEIRHVVSFSNRTPSLAYAWPR